MPDARLPIVCLVSALVSWTSASPTAAAPDARPADEAPQLPTLTPFDLDLQNVEPAALRQAIKKAGGKPLKAAGGSGGDNFDVTAIGLPGMRTLKLTFHRGRLVAAVYGGDRRLGSSGGDEKMRKMLVDKYGQPAWYVSESPAFGGKKSAPPQDFTGRFVAHGKYLWEFAGGMQLVLKKTFFGDVELSYVDPQRFAELKQLATQVDDNDARTQAKQKRHAF